MQWIKRDTLHGCRRNISSELYLKKSTRGQSQEGIAMKLMNDLVDKVANFIA